MSKKPAKVIKGVISIEGGVNIWPHELHIATALVNAGHNVRFIPAHNSIRSADAYVDNTIFEFKSPEGSNIRAVERNIVKAINHQSPNVAISTLRMKKIKDRSVKNYLVANYSRLKGIKHLIFVTRDGVAIDINDIVR